MIIYGIISKVIKNKIIWHIHLYEGKGLKKVIRNLLCDYKIYVSKAQIESASKKPFYILNNFIEKPINLVDSQKRSAKLKKIFMIGTISKRKNQLFGIKLISKLNDNYQLIICGDILDKNYYYTLKKEIKSLKIKNKVKFISHLDREYIYNMADIVLIASQYESFGLVFIESLAFGIPVIAPDLKCFQEICQKIGYNMIYRQNEINDAIQKLKNAKDMDIKIFQKKVFEIYSYKNFKNNLLNIFNRISVEWQKK